MKMWSSSGKSTSSDIFNRQKQCHFKAFELISRALELDEQNVNGKFSKSIILFVLLFSLNNRLHMIFIDQSVLM